MRHPLEIFDTDALRLMASAIEAAVQTMRLTGAEPDNTGRLAMARSVIAAAGRGENTILALTESILSEHLWLHRSYARTA
jgi:predicted transcriptional regulator